MSRRRVAAALVLAVGWLGAVPPAQAAAEPVRADVSDVSTDGDVLRMTVDVAGLPVGATVDPASVRVSVAGRNWPATATSAGAPGNRMSRRAMVVVDTSGSMGAQGIADARAASMRFLAAVPADVSVGFATFASTAQVAVQPTTDRAPVVAALSRMRPLGNTRLYDGIALALSALGDDGERALIVLSDGKDTASSATLAQVDARLRSVGATVDLVAFRTEGAQVDVLRQLASSAGGRVSEVSSGSQLGEVFASAGRGLASKMVVTAPVPDGAVAGPAEAVIQLAVGGQTLATTARFTLPTPQPDASDPTGTAQAAPTVTTAPVPWLLPLVLVMFFLALFLLVMTAMSPVTWGRNGSMLRSKEIERYGLAGVSDVLPTPSAETLNNASQTALEWAGRAVQKRGVEGSWRTALDRAGLPLRPQEWLIIRLGVALAAAALAVMLLPWWFVTGPLGALLGWGLAGAYVGFRAKRRLKRFADGLPDVLQLVAGSLRTGFSLPQAVDNAAKDGQEPIAGEFARALAESRLGVPLEDTLERVAERMDNTDLAWTVMAVRIAREVGGNLAEVLLSTAETMRERSRIQRQVRVLSAEGRLSAYVLLGLPVGITVFMLLFRRSYIMPLVTDPIGWVMTTYGVLSVLVGAWWMSRLVKLEV